MNIDLLKPVLAQTIKNPITGSFWTIVNIVIDVLIKVVRAFFVTVVIYAGIVIITSAGDPGKFEEGKSIIFKALIAWAVAESARYIIFLLIQAFS